MKGQRQNRDKKEYKKEGKESFSITTEASAWNG